MDNINKAIKTIQKYVNEKDIVSFQYQFPYESIPIEFDKEDWEFKHKLKFKEEILADIIYHRTLAHYNDLFLMESNATNIQFYSSSKIDKNYHERINQYETLYKEIKDGDSKEIEEVVEIINHMQFLEDFFLEEANLLEDIEIQIQNEIKEFSIKISDTKEW